MYSHTTTREGRQTFRSRRRRCRRSGSVRHPPHAAGYGLTPHKAPRTPHHDGTACIRPPAAAPMYSRRPRPARHPAPPGLRAAPPPRGLPEPSHALRPAAARRPHALSLLAAAPVHFRLSFARWAARGRGGAGARMAGCGRHGARARPECCGGPPGFGRGSFEPRRRL